MALSEMPNGLVMWDSEQKIVIGNYRFREMYGLKAEQVAPGNTLAPFLCRNRCGKSVPCLRLRLYWSGLSHQLNGEAHTSIEVGPAQQ